MNQRHNRFLLMTTVLVLFLLPNIASAVDEPETGGLSFEVVQPKSQVDKEVGFFDVRLKPGEEELLLIQLNNSSNKDITVKTDINTTKTNSNGVLEYGKYQNDNDPSLKYPLEKIITLPGDVVVPANGGKDLILTLKMPDSSFEGVISGGIYIEDKDQEGIAEGTVINKFAYIVGVLVSQSDYADIKPELKYNKTYADQNNYRNAIVVDFSNTKAVFFDDMTVDVQITGEDNEQVIYDAKKTGMRMAPNSLIKFPVMLNGEKLVPGDYKSNVVVTGKKGEKWEWKEPFTITDEEADKFNSSDVSLIQEDSVNWKLIGIVVGVIIGMTIVIYISLIQIKKAKEKQNKKSKKSKKRK